MATTLRKDSIVHVYQGKTVRLVRNTETIGGIIIPAGQLMRVEDCRNKTMVVVGELDGKTVKLKNIQPRQVEVVGQ